MLSVDVGASATTVAAAWNGDLRLSVQTNLGLGAGAAAALADTPVDTTTRWLPSSRVTWTPTARVPSNSTSCTRAP